MAREPFIKFDNHVSLGHIFTTGTIIVSCVVYALSIENRLNLLERNDQVMEKRIEDNRGDVKEALNDIKVTLHEISTKIDKKADK